MGFGTDTKGVKEFIASGSLLGDLGSQFVAGWVGELITIGAAVSAFGCALACVVGATRLLYALSRDEVGPPPLGTVSARNGVPVRSTATVAVAVCRHHRPRLGRSSAWRLSTCSWPRGRSGP